MDTEVSTSREITIANPKELVRQSSDVAGLCKEIVTRTALTIQDRKFVRVEGWQSIATAHGCVAGARDVERIDGGFRAIGEIRRMSDGALLATAEGFVGEDEPTWFGGEHMTRNGTRTLPKRPDYAIRAMAQTRAISRVCRSAFAHCVVLMDAGLSTTPAEEADFMHDNDRIEQREEQREREARQNGSTNGHGKPFNAYQEAKRIMTEPAEFKGDWRDVVCTYGRKDGPLRGKRLGDLNTRNLQFLAGIFLKGDVDIAPKDKEMVDALRHAQNMAEPFQSPPDPKLRELQKAGLDPADDEIPGIHNPDSSLPF